MGSNIKGHLLLRVHLPEVIGGLDGGQLGGELKLAREGEALDVDQLACHKQGCQGV